MNVLIKNFKPKVTIVWYGIPDLSGPVLESTYSRIFDMAYRNIMANKALTC
jgi:hypothetical protein